MGGLNRVAVGRVEKLNRNLQSCAWWKTQGFFYIQCIFFMLVIAACQYGLVHTAWHLVGSRYGVNQAEWIKKQENVQ